MITEAEKLPKIESIWKHFQSDEAIIIRYILNKNLAVCDNIFTKDGCNFAFCFNIEDRNFEYDEQVFVKNPACFYMEDREILAVTDRTQGLLTINEYKKVAQSHPTTAITLIDNQNHIDIISGEKSDLLEGEKGDWYL